MSQTAKTAREAMKAKAKRLASADPHMKVDSSTWTPPEPLNADIKTGMRPLSRRAFKKGGKVIGNAEGEKAKHRSDRAPRASGGKLAKYIKGATKNLGENQYDEGYRSGQQSVAEHWDLPGEAEEGGNPIQMRNREKGIGLALKKLTGKAKVPARKDGGRATRYLTPDNLLNRDQKMANEAREGIKHVGGLKRGGKAFPDLTGDGKVTKADILKGRGVLKSGGKIKKFGGGDIVGDNPVSVQNRSMGKAAGVMKKGGRAHHATKGSVANPMTQDRTPTNIPAGKMVDAKDIDQAYYDMAPKTEAQRVGSARSNAERAGKTYSDTLNLASTMKDANQRKSVMENADRAARSASAASEDYERAKQQAGYKKGGKTKNWEGSKKDEAQDRMLAKKYGISMEKWEKSEKDKKHDKQQSMKGLKEGGRTAKYSGGGVFSGESYPGKVPGATGGRHAHAKGGKAGKGKTNINIVIASGPPKGEGMMPNAPVPAPKAMPVPPPAAGMPMMPPPGMAPAGGPPVPPPGMMPRKNGGRTIHVIDHAAGGGLGRLEKIKAYGLKSPK